MDGGYPGLKPRAVVLPLFRGEEMLARSLKLTPMGGYRTAFLRIRRDFCGQALYRPKPNAVLFERGLVFVQTGRQVVQVFDVTLPIRLAKAERGWNLRKFPRNFIIAGYSVVVQPSIRFDF